MLFSNAGFLLFSSSLFSFPHAHHLSPLTLPLCPPPFHPCLQTGSSPVGCADLLPLWTAYCRLLPGPSAAAAQHGLRGTSAEPGGAGGPGTMRQGNYTDNRAARRASRRQHRHCRAGASFSTTSAQTTYWRTQWRTLPSPWAHWYTQIWTLAGPPTSWSKWCAGLRITIALDWRGSRAG